jgi:membrane protein
MLRGEARMRRFRRNSLLAVVEAGAAGSVLAPWARALRNFSAHRGGVRAASLSYTSLLALVPLLALVLSVSKGILRNQDPQLLLRAIDRALDYAVPQLRYLSADDAASARSQAFARIQDAIDRIDAGALGAFGAVTLVGVGISLLSAIERAFNDIWGVARGRTLARRVVYYWAGVTLGPLFLLLAIGITGSNTVASVLGHLPAGAIVRWSWRVAPFVILSAGLMLLYWAMPNTPVAARAAAWGGVTAGILLQVNNLASALYFSQVLHYSRVYGSLGAIPVMMVGLYLSWTIVLYGAEVTHAAASPGVEALPFPQGDTGRSRVVLEVARVAAAGFLAGEGGVSRAGLVERLRFPDEWVADALELLCEAGLFALAPREHEGEPPRYLPARPPSRIGVLEILDAVRRPAAEAQTIPEPATPVGHLLDELAAAERRELGNVTLEALAAPPAGP